MKYWWVNHKQTSKYEIAGGFLWSPMRKKNGGRNQFYDNMRLASPGDLVISYSDTKISFVGLVVDFAIPAPKPPSFGDTGKNWSKQGWLLTVNWQSLIESVRPKQRIEQLRKLLPPKYSPINPVSGNGYQHAYLANIEKPIFDFLVGTNFLKANVASVLEFSLSEITMDIDNSLEEAIKSDEGLDSTTKQRVSAARLGQGVFRERVCEFEKFCRLTGLATPGLLIASHIKPWRLCDTSVERLDGANGLLLSPNVDRLFDRGLISFTDQGVVLVSPKLLLGDVKALGLSEAFEKGCSAFHERQTIFLKFHREKIFLV